MKKPFKIYMLYHSHIDIGYTERQEKITRYQADFIKQAIDCALSDKQKTRKNKFKFTAEGFWAVERYLETYGQDGKERLISAIKSGYFELTGFYFHLAELLNYNNLEHSVKYSLDFIRENNLEKIEVAMAADINGFSWGISDILYDNGIKYLSTSINTHHGGAPFSKPLMPFYWQTPKGNKILVWNGLTYHKANLLGLIPGMTPIGDPGVPGMKVDRSGFVMVNHPDDYAKEMIFKMRDGLISNGYEYDFMLISGSGLYTDNSPIGDEHCELIDEWNQLYGDEIEIETVTLAEYFNILENENIEINTYKGDWNDWWTDGVISTPIETKIFRNAQRTQKLIQKIDNTNKIISRDEHNEIINKLILYSEHTWGHSASFSDPYRLLVHQLDSRKAHHAVCADILSSTALDKMCRKIGEGEFTHRRDLKYVVINPHDFEVNSVVDLPVDFWEEGLFTNNDYYVTDGEKNYVTQKRYTLRGSFISVLVNLHPNQRLDLQIKFGKSISPTIKCLNGHTFENDFYKIDFANGVTSLINKKSNQELLMNDIEHLGMPVYQVFRNGQRHNAAGFGYSIRDIPNNEIHYSKVKDVKIKDTGNIFTSVNVEYECEGTKKATVEFRFFNDLPLIELSTLFAKDLEIDPEGLYVAFPFSASGEWYLDKPGAFFKPGDQLPDTCCDYYAIDRGVVLKSENEGIVVNTIDTPMVSFGKIKLWEFTKTIKPNGKLYSWILNNKWETNFKAECAGFLESRYSISLIDNVSEQTTFSTLELNDVPLLVLRK